VHVGGESAKSDNAIEQKNRQVNRLRVESELLYFRKNHGLMGVFSHIFLTHLADIYDLLKACLRLNGLAGIAANLKSYPLIWQIFCQTQCATKSTR
jgi:hypothetical protein